MIIWISEESTEELGILKRQCISHNWILVIILLAKVLSLHDFVEARVWMLRINLYRCGLEGGVAGYWMLIGETLKSSSKILPCENLIALNISNHVLSPTFV